ncbi:hypothetical protein NDU88_003030 [Pleurodeles waltl]|uniref:Uncharacterized protein n=1 Tax=Pleurodeles waltl TaxID=8319 RepID=A0AAV7TMX9_PLEWA|nr:hypothetical protein NDU88_003030 [Pleurodeles waltl]
MAGGSLPRLPFVIAEKELIKVDYLTRLSCSGSSKRRGRIQEKKTTNLNLQIVPDAYQEVKRMQSTLEAADDDKPEEEQVELEYIEVLVTDPELQLLEEQEDNIQEKGPLPGQGTMCLLSTCLLRSCGQEG